MTGLEAIKAGIKKGISLEHRGTRYTVSRKTKAGLYIRMRVMTMDAKGRQRSTPITEFITWPQVFAVFQHEPIRSALRDLTKRTRTPQAKRKSSAARKSKPKARKPLSKRAFLERMAKGRAAAARKRNRGR